MAHTHAYDSTMCTWYIYLVLIACVSSLHVSKWNLYTTYRWTECFLLFFALFWQQREKNDRGKTEKGTHNINDVCSGITMMNGIRDFSVSLHQNNKRCAVMWMESACVRAHIDVCVCISTLLPWNDDDAQDVVAIVQDGTKSKKQNWVVFFRIACKIYTDISIWFHYCSYYFATHWALRRSQQKKKEKKPTSYPIANDTNDTNVDIINWRENVFEI